MYTSMDYKSNKIMSKQYLPKNVENKDIVYIILFFSSVKNFYRGGEMAEKLRVFAAFAEDLSLGPSTHMSHGSAQLFLTPIPGNPISSPEHWSLDTHTYMQVTLIHINLKSFCKV